MVGDILFLKTGMQIPADGIILEASDLKIDASVMTGESEHIKVETFDKCKNKIIFIEENN